MCYPFQTPCERSTRKPMTQKTLTQLYASHTGKVSDKWSSYLVEYDRLFNPYRHKPINLLEIGIQNGGSIEIWAKYFEKAQTIIGCDINPDCESLRYDDPRISIVVGDANATKTYQKITKINTGFDLIIDDGSHTSGDIIQTFDKYFPQIKEDGLFVAEDLHCSYWKNYEGGLFNPHSSISFFKLLADIINHEHWGVDKKTQQLIAGFNKKYHTTLTPELLEQVHSIKFINSICVVRKQATNKNNLGERFISGMDEFIQEGIISLHGSKSSTPPQTDNTWSARKYSPSEELPIRLKELIELKQKIEVQVDKEESLNSRIDDLKKELTASKSEIEKKTLSFEQAEALSKRLSTELDSKSAKLDNANAKINQLLTKVNHAEEILEEVLSNNNKYKKLRKIPSKFSISYFLNKEKRRLIKDKQVIAKSGLFSPAYYLLHNYDVWKADTNPLNHFCNFGWIEGREPSSSFNCDSYLKKNKDVANSKTNPLVHYIRYGEKERRQFSSQAVFDSNQIIQFAYPKNHTNKAHKSSIIKILYDIKDDNELLNDEVIKLSKQIIKTRALKISVIMPTWERENVIALAIDSVLQQSHLPHELIISDDGSVDNTIKLIKNKYKKEISTGLIKIISNTHNGVSATRNAALQVATGDLIAYLDSDNQWRKHYLLLMIAIFSEDDETNCAYCALDIHNNNSNKRKILLTEFDRRSLLTENFIDLNVFMHRSYLYTQFGGFDTTLNRLVDWDLIIRYTKNYPPAVVPFVGVDYFLDNNSLKNITTTVSLDGIFSKIYQKNFSERVNLGLEKLKIAYVIWDFPALSQTFVMNELRWLVQQGFDVKVYYSTDPEKSAELDFKIKSYHVTDSNQLAELLVAHERNLCHSQFVYPAVTLLTYPAAVKVGIPFTFMPHAVDLFHHLNKKRNKISEIVSHPLCLKVFVYGDFHKQFLMDQGVPEKKIGFNFQAVNLTDFNVSKTPSNNKINSHSEQKIQSGLVIARFIEKKGIKYLIEAANLLRKESVEFNIYGYGELQKTYEKKVSRLKLKNIHFKGVIENSKELSESYKKADFLIVPSVIAENGDMDGFPTVILEAIAADLPIITTDVSAIPDYLTNGVDAIVVPAKNKKTLADGVTKLLGMSPEQKSAMVKRSHNFLHKMVGVHKSMKVMLDTWENYTIDIILVTYNTSEYDDQNETFEIISRILKHTTTPFTLTIIDNNSDNKFWSKLSNRFIGYENIRIIRKYNNQYCGPASNIALELCKSEFAIYICSKEGFINKHGWERTLIDHMRENSDNVMAGHYSQMPNYIYGREYINHPEFSKFRNPDFAKNNPNKIFKHVQGGVYIIQKAFIKEHGGFNPATPHNGMDIEMSYYIESLGYELGEIPEVASITVKTLPKLPAILNENTVIAHPFSMKNINNDFDSLIKTNGHRCSICGWKGKLFEQGQKCPECYSTGFGRSLLKILSNNHHIYRNEKALILTSDPTVKEFTTPFFNSLLVTDNEEIFKSTLSISTAKLDLIIVDFDCIKESTKLWKLMLTSLSEIGEVIFTDALFLDECSIGASKSRNTNIKNAFSSKQDNNIIKYTDFTSYCIAYDWRRFGVVQRNA